LVVETYVETTTLELDHTRGMRLIMRLTGTAKSSFAILIVVDLKEKKSLRHGNHVKPF